MRRRVFGLAGCAALAMATSLALTVPASALAACHVRNARTGAGYRSLVRAIGAARSGDTLRIQGTCLGSLRRQVAAFQITKNLTLQGVSTRSTGQATLDGRYVNTVVETGAGTSVTLAGLVIRRGQDFGVFADFDSSLQLVDSSVQTTRGTGIVSFHDLTVRNSRVVSNRGGDGGINQGDGGLRIYHSVISGNEGVAGIIAAGDRYEPVEVVDSTVSWNRGRDAGGILVLSAPAVSIRHSRIVHNTVTNEVSGIGGGIWVSTEATVVLLDSLLRHNTAANHGGGLYVSTYGSVTLAGSTVLRENTSGSAGGGLAVDGGVATASDGSDVDPATGLLLPAWTGRIFGNQPDDCALLAGVLTLSCG